MNNVFLKHTLSVKSGTLGLWLISQPQFFTSILRTSAGFTEMVNSTNPQRSKFVKQTSPKTDVRSFGFFGTDGLWGRELRATGAPREVACARQPQARAPTNLGPSRLPPSAAVTCPRSRARRRCHCAVVPASSVWAPNVCRRVASALLRLCCGRRASELDRSPPAHSFASPPLSRWGLPGPLLSPGPRRFAGPQGLPGRTDWRARGGRAGGGVGKAALCTRVPATPGASRFCLGPAVCADLACLGCKFPPREMQFRTD